MSVGEWTETTKLMDGDAMLHVLRCSKSSSLVLTNQLTGEPILSVRIQSRTGDFPPAPVCLVDRPDGIKQYVIVSPPRTNAFSFRASNFSADTVAFSIFHGRGDEANPSEINSVNCLPPYQSVDVLTDYSAGEREFLLEPLDGNTTVSQDEVRQGGAKGTYFTIRVYPTTDKDDWRQTYWRTTGVVCVRKRQLRFPQPSTPTLGVSLDPWRRSRGTAWGAELSPAGGGFGAPPVATSTAAVGGWGSPPGTWGASPQATPIFGVTAGGAVPAYKPAFAVAEPDQNVFAERALATRLTHGEVREVRTATTELSAKYDKGSPGAVMCLSMHSPENVALVPDATTHREKLAETLEEVCRFLRGELFRPENQPVYEAEKECTVCMDSAPQCIFARCGHVNTCKTCYQKLPDKKCPVCRAPIHAALALTK